jgi:hypothetical protein
VEEVKPVLQLFGFVGTLTAFGFQARAMQSPQSDEFQTRIEPK